MSTSRTYDLVVLAATGYSGSKVCAHLARAADGYKWAVAGRDAQKLEALKKELQLPAEVGTLIADTSNAEALNNVCRSTRVVIACAGPFDLVGMPVVKACVENGTHYCDITGEFQFFRKAIEAYDEKAAKNGVMIVPCCGFDCIPSDLGNWLVHEAARSQQRTVQSVTGYFTANGAPSGGTMASIANLFDTLEKKDMSPASLTPKSAPRVATPMTKWIRYSSAIGKWVGPYIMAGINERVVRRSNALANINASYVEAAAGPSWAAVFFGAVGFYVFGILLAIPPIRALLRRFVFPAQGTGPSDDSLAKGFFKAIFIGKTTNGESITVHVRDQRDAYTATGVFAATSGMVAADLSRRGAVVSGGVLTASSAFGSELCDRLRSAGMTFEVVDGERKKQK